MSIKSKILKLSLIPASLVASAGAFAAETTVPAGASAAFTEIKEQGMAMVDLAWPVIAALTAAFIAVKIFKRASSKV